MEEFLEKWKKDKKYQVKIKLLLYTSFVAIVSIFAISTRDIPTNTKKEDNHNINNNQQEENNHYENLINIPEKYNYIINVNIDEVQYTYKGTKTSNEETIITDIDGKINNYLYKEGNYYIEENEQYVLTNEEKIYNKVSKNYIDLLTIKKYLSKSIKEGNQYYVYLKDIILGNNSEDYIIIELDKTKINIDYTPLINSFDKNITKYQVNIDVEEIE